MDKKTVVLFIRGFPGSGKTTISKHIVNKYGFKHINPDFIKDLYKKSDRRERLRKFDLCVKQLKIYLDQDTSVVWDQPWRKSYNIKKIISSLKDYFSFYPLIIELKIPAHISWERSKDKFINKEEFDNYISKYLVINTVYPKLIINSQEDYDKNITRVDKFLEYNITHG
jgi:adenylate kinase family enzyme